MEKDRRLIQVAFKEILAVVKNVFKEQLRGITITPGITAVLHTFGEDMKFNVHFHCIVTSGGVNDCGDWVKLRFFFYEGLRKVWQYHVLTAMKKALPKSWENNRLIDKMFKDHPNGFYVYAKDEINNDKGLLKYIARYVRHPAIAQSRITGFDGEIVTFLCKKDEEGKQRKIELPVQQFLLALAQHIPPKGFQMTKHLGLYANRSRKRYASVISMFLKVVKISQRKLLEHTPRCKQCMGLMELIEITQTSVPPPELLLSSYYGQLKLRGNA
ncbi:MAG: transposase [Candidatus Berkelbacteria bacterium]|nr:transposase [Candidatus Berkelbacteria bacterium]